MADLYKQTEEKLRFYLRGYLEQQIKHLKDMMNILPLDEEELSKKELLYKEITQEKNAISDYIDDLNENDKLTLNVLTLRYERERSWLEIEYALNYSSSTCKRRAKEGIEELSEQLFN